MVERFCWAILDVEFVPGSTLEDDIRCLLPDIVDGQEWLLEHAYELYTEGQRPRKAIDAVARKRCCSCMA